jgi:hypothetical protein
MTKPGPPQWGGPGFFVHFRAGWGLPRPVVWSEYEDGYFDCDSPREKKNLNLHFIPIYDIKWD